MSEAGAARARNVHGQHSKGGCGPDRLHALLSPVHSAPCPAAPKRWPVSPRASGPSAVVQDFAELGSLLEGTPFGRPFEAAVDPFFEHLRTFMRGFERMAQGGRCPCCRASPVHEPRCATNAEHGLAALIDGRAAAGVCCIWAFSRRPSRPLCLLILPCSRRSAVNAWVQRTLRIE